ncbi:hypothetical protein BGX21_004347 [Mortierella sp. AD011]|nr:hypothetical protein BGX20_004130 [Mortierella sp. AD010]KAF9373694.1 hypothetical protein BGX21_004347 [Mortierella sp. AD011]
MSRLMTKVATLATLALGFFNTIDAAESVGSAANYTGTLCADYVDYTVWLAPGQNMSSIEQSLVAQGMTKDALSLLPETCLGTLMQYACSSAYPRIEATNQTDIYNVRFACKSTCEADVSVCGSILTMAGKANLVPNCDGYIPGTTITVAPGILFQPDGACNVVTSKSASGTTTGSQTTGTTVSACPAPFITDPMSGAGNTTANSDYCDMGCCLPCPAQYSLYHTDVLKTGYTITNIMRLISMILSFVVMISYIFLPDKRSHPSALILYFSTCVFLFSVVVIFPLVNTRGMQCFDAINPSTQQNNLKCAIQGAILIFASIGTCAWCSALILNLHMHTVWNSAWFAKKYWLIHSICWGYATAITAAALGMGQVRWEFATLCLISQEKSSSMFFYPMAAMLFPAFLIHVATFIHIARISAQAGVDSETMSRSTLSAGAAAVISHRRHVMMAIKIQWRAAVMAIFAILCVMFYWLFYFLQLKKIKPATLRPHVRVFAGCLAQGTAHNTCADQLAPYLPPYGLMIAAEFLVSMIGSVIFIVFFKMTLFQEWGDWFGSIGYLLGGKRRQQKEQDQFFVI